MTISDGVFERRLRFWIHDWIHTGATKTVIEPAQSATHSSIRQTR